MYRMLSLCLVALVARPVLAGEQPAAPDGLARVAPLVDEQTFAVARVGLEKLDAGDLVKLAGKFVKMKPGDAATAELPLRMALTTLKNAGATDVFVVGTLSGFPQDAFFAAIPAKGGDTKKIAAAVKNMLAVAGPALPPGKSADLVHSVHGLVVIAPGHVAKRLAAMKSAPSPALKKALSSHADADVQVAAVMTEPLRRALGELVPSLPKELGGGKTAPLLGGFRSFAAGISFTPKLSVAGTVQAADAASAKALRAALNSALKHIKEQVKKESPAPELLEQFDKAVGLLTPKIEQDRLVWKLAEPDLVSVLRPLAAQMQANAARAGSANNLRQLLLAQHSFLDVHKRFATNIHDKKGKALLSWRVQLLPYLEQQQLYQQFKLDESWDSPHNKALIAKMPPIFRSPLSQLAADKTTYLGPRGKGLFLSGVAPVKVKDIADGLGNTILILEVDDARAVPWTKPDDLHVDPKDPLAGLGNNDAKSFWAAFGDGHVQAIERKIAAKTFYGLLTIAGGEAVQP